MRPLSSLWIGGGCGQRPAAVLPRRRRAPTLGVLTLRGAASAAPRGHRLDRADLGVSRRLRLRNRAAAHRGPLVARRGYYALRRVVDGRHQRPSTRRIRAPVRRTLCRRRARVLGTCSPPFGSPRGGAGARATRAPGRPRWVKTGFGARPRPAAGPPFGAHSLPCGNSTFSGKLSQNRARIGPECFISNAEQWLEHIAPPETYLCTLFASRGGPAGPPRGGRVRRPMARPGRPARRASGDPTSRRSGGDLAPSLTCRFPEA